MACRVAIIGLLFFGAFRSAESSWIDWFQSGSDDSALSIFSSSGGVEDGCRPTCEWQCSSPRCEQNCTTKCEDVDCPEPVCHKQPCKVQCEKPQADCKWREDDEECAKTNCSFAKPICAKPQCEMVCPPPKCEKTKCKKRCEWNCKVNLNEDGKPCCKSPQCELVCEDPAKCSDLSNKPKAATSYTAGANLSGRPVERTYKVDPPHNATKVTKTPAVNLAHEEAGDCKPSCGWNCTSKKKYAQKCEKVCAKPANCEVRCEKPPTEQCETTCKFSDCGTDKTTVPDCPMKDCPNATQSCSKKDCIVTCPEPKCATFCDEPVCDWQCELPPNISSQDDVACHLECNKPKDCLVN